MMAAYAALVSLMNLLDDIQHHHSPPISLYKDQIQSLTEYVIFLQEFLQAYMSPVSDLDEADPLEMRIADAAYAAEDAIGDYIYYKILFGGSKQIQTRSKPTKTRRFFNWFQGPTPNDPGNFPSDLDVVIQFYKNVRNVIQEMDQIKRVAIMTNTPKVVVLRDQPHKFVSSSTGKESGVMVFSDDVLYEIMEKLVADESGRQVIPITGMGGIGKTALAQTVYSKQVIKERFDIRAWATISQHYNTREILCELVSQATKKKKEQLSHRSPGDLGLELYQYLSARRFLIVMDDMWNIESWNEIQHFFPNNGNSSRIMVTTRLSQLSFQLNNHYSHQMQFLDEASSWVLFSKTVFGEECFPFELEKIGKEIANNCRGLPLSIVVVGGVLKNEEHTQKYWKSIRNNLTSVVNLDNNKHCLRLLKLSYNHLPAYLKPCFLSMGTFKEDEAIKVSTLVKLWVYEGFLKPIDDKSLETIGKKFLKDLVDRNLVLVDELGATGNIKWVRVHDLLRDICLNQGKKEGFYHVKPESSSRGINSQDNVVRSRDTSKFKVHAVEVGSISSNFSSFNHLWNLQKLTICCRNVSTTPTEIWKMSLLRHIEMAGELLLPDPPVDAAVMANLVILEGALNFKCDVQVVKIIPNIKKLRIRYSGSKGMVGDDYYCLNNIKCLSKLESLDISCGNGFGGNASLYKLTFPQTLKSLTLKMICDIEWEMVLEQIGSLPLLEKLKLSNGRFGTDNWEIFEGQFPSLKYLALLFCNSLKHWTTEASSIFPRLEKLRLYYLKGLESIPSEIGYIPTLQKIWILDCTESVVICAKEIVEEQMDLQGDDLSFQVEVEPPQDVKEAMQSLAGPNFQVM